MLSFPLESVLQKSPYSLPAQFTLSIPQAQEYKSDNCFRAKPDRAPIKPMGHKRCSFFQSKDHQVQKHISMFPLGSSLITLLPCSELEVDHQAGQIEG